MVVITPLEPKVDLDIQHIVNQWGKGNDASDYEVDTE